MFLSFEYRSVNLMKRNRQIICSFIFIAFLVTVTGTALASDVNVEQVGHLGGYTDAIDVVDNHAYIGQGQDFLILDITNPSSPVTLGKININCLAADIKVFGNYACVVSYNSGLVIVDISNPSSPTIKGMCWAGGGAEGVSVSGNYAYVVSSNSGLVIVDISNPSSPIIKGNCSLKESNVSRKFSVSGNYAYVADDKDLVIVDISNPSSPTIK